MGKRGRPKKGSHQIVFVPDYEMKPFLREIEECTKDLDFALRMYFIELKSQGHTEKEAEAKMQEAYEHGIKKATKEHESWGDLGAG